MKNISKFLFLSLFAFTGIERLIAQPVETIVGTGVAASYPALGIGANGDGMGTAINIKPGQSMCADAANNIYFTDRQGKYIRKWDYITRQVITVAGNGATLPPNVFASPNTGSLPDDGSLATSVNIQAYSVCVTSNGQYLYFSQGYNIRLVNLVTGIITTVVGYNVTASETYCSDLVVKDNLFARFAAISTNSQQSLTLDEDNNLYIAESVSSRRIRQILRNPTTGIADGNSAIKTIAFGVGQASATDGISGYAQIPKSGVNACSQPNGYGYIGSNSGGMSLIYRSGNLYFTEFGSPTSSSGLRFRKMNLNTSQITTICFSSIPSVNTDQLVLDNLNNMYAVDKHTGAIYKVTQTGVFSTFFTPFCGFGSSSGPYPSGSNLSTVCVGFTGGATLTFNSIGDLFFADGSFNTINKITFCANTPEPIVGLSNVCVGSSISLSNATAGGTWSSIAGRVSINASGLVTGTSSGVALIRYTLPVAPTLGCLNYVEKTISVNALPAVPSVAYQIGTPNPRAGAPAGSFCRNRTFTLVGFPSGGSWSAGGVASVNSAGEVTLGASIGVGSITYTTTNTNGCSNSRTITGNVVACASRSTFSSQPSTVDHEPWTLYPNPARTFVNLQIDRVEGKGSIVVTDLYGKTIKVQPLSLGTNSIDVSGFAKGMYLVSTITTKGKTTKKVVVE
jgi:hypothetical protein